MCDICHGPTLQRLLSEICDGQVRGVILSPHSATMSTVQQPDVVDNPASENIKYEKHCSAGATRICKVCLVSNRHFSCMWRVEHSTSMIFHKKTTLISTDQCMFGSPWRKQTGLRFGNLPDECTETLTAKCSGRRTYCCCIAKPSYDIERVCFSSRREKKSRDSETSKYFTRMFDLC